MNLPPNHPATTIRADLPGFPDLLDGWAGPIVHLGHLGGQYPGYLIPGPRPAVWWYSCPVKPGSTECCHVHGLAEIRLDLTRPEARARLAHVLAVGLRCRTCDGTGDHPLRDAKGQTCDRCSGTGTLRKPAPCWHLLTRDEGGSLPEEHRAHVPALLARHAEDVGRGGRGVVGGPMPLWRDVEDGHACRDHNEGGPFCVARATPNVEGYGWWFKRGYYDLKATAWGPETGDAGKAAADAAALGHGLALLGDGLRLPTGGGGA